MECTIIADSSCDMTPELKKRLGVVNVPFTVMLGEKEYIDDEALDIYAFIADMGACKEKSGSGAPAPILYQEAIENAVSSFVITLSSRLSGSYSSAMVAVKEAEKNGKFSHVFDSKSATAGEVLLAVKLRELIQGGMSRESIIQTMNSFIDNMKTYFVLGKCDNLQKNGRLNKVAGKLISVLNVKLIMGADENGEIGLYGNARGVNKMIMKMLALIKDSGKKTEGENLVITHCDNPGLAEQLRSAIVEAQFSFKEIFVLQSRGLSAFYTDHLGIVMAF